MDHAAFHVLYVDNRLSPGLDGKHIQKGAQSLSDTRRNPRDAEREEYSPDCLKAIIGEIEEVRTNLNRLLAQFNGVHTCTCERTCMANLRRLDNASPDPNPTLVFSGTTFAPRHQSQEAASSPLSATGSPAAQSDGLILLQRISNEIGKSNLSKLVIPVAFIHRPNDGQPHQPESPRVNSARPSSGGLLTLQKTTYATADIRESGYSQRNAIKCLDAGAIDALDSPLEESRLQSLILQAYRSYRTALQEQQLLLEKKRSRKLSWLGNTENKPYAYLREKMVSELMTGICNPDEHFHLGKAKGVPALDPSREEQLTKVLGSWSYWGHGYSEDELVHAARLMLQHALTLPELERFRISSEKLTNFLMASKAAYNDFVEYHNFRHVIDVMQATFYFLIQLGALPPYPSTGLTAGVPVSKSSIASLLRPVDALTLLITAIGHDVGHPGVNNAFLVSLNAPLAQLYNDRSVLEAFHCAAYSQILRRYWRVVFEDSEMRSLMINSILATDMGVHQKYMTDLGNLQEKLHHQGDLDGFNAQQLGDYRVLACALLIKCADISNVARPYDIAVQWADILQLEFANQGVMEEEVGIPTTLFGGPPELGNLIKLGQSQKSFMNFFAQPLFEAVTDILPPMAFAVDELRTNHAIWSERIRTESEKPAPDPRSSEASNSTLSPRSRSQDRSGSQPELSVSEGLPASNPPNDELLNLSLPQSTFSLPLSRNLSDPSPGAHQQIPKETAGSPTGQTQQSPPPQSLSNPGANSDALANPSRRSSGAFSPAGNATAIPAPRRTSNSSPSQLQLAHDSRNLAPTLSTDAAQRGSDNRASEDTLLHSHLNDGTAFSSEQHVKPLPQPPSDQSPDERGKRPIGIAQSTSTYPPVSSIAGYEHTGHNRSSSGAHTNNTNISQSAPYSPTGTQATSVMTTDSDGKSAHNRIDSWSDWNGAATRHNALNERTDRGFSAWTNGRPETKPVESKPSLVVNGSLRNCTDLGPRVLGKKGSKFNIFHSWKRRGNRSESSS